MNTVFFSKAHENLQAAEVLSEQGLFNAGANRAYYAAFHAAIAVLAVHGIRHDKNPHEWVQAQFSSEIIHRRKLLARSFASYLTDIQRVRNVADYAPSNVSKKVAAEQFKQAEHFVSTLSHLLEQS
jgi:uncharacterized protein (UPF0332 family)